MSFTLRQLFGGAVVCEIPTLWRDVSEVRQVPDHQEVYQDLSTDPKAPASCLVVEILEHQSHQSNAAAAAFFFQDLAQANGVITSQQDDQNIHFVPQASLRSAAELASSLSGETATVCGGIGIQRIAPGRSNNSAVGRLPTLSETRWVVIELCAIRLPQVHTDLLVTLSVPSTSQQGEATVPVDYSSTFRQIVASLRIVDWGLFGG